MHVALTPPLALALRVWGPTDADASLGVGRGRSMRHAMARKAIVEERAAAEVRTEVRG